MASSISSTTSKSGIENLDSYYQNLINYTLTQEKQPITRLSKQKDDLTVKKGAYTDLKSKFDTLLGSIKALHSTEETYKMEAGRSVSVTPATSNTTVATASVTSSASAGTYKLSVTSLATAHEVRSNRQTYSNQALGLTGTFVIGGAVSRSVSIENSVPANVVSVETGATESISTSQKELGTGSYYVETRKSGENWQFRLVDADGNAQNIRDGETNDFTSEWQNIRSGGGAFDTGRGLIVNFGTDSGAYTQTNKATGAVKLDYQAQGATINVTSEMSLASIKAEINSATYAAGNEVIGSIVDNVLVLKNEYTGASHVMQASDSSGDILSTLGVLSGGTLNTKVTAKNAFFSINEMEMERSSNTGLTDVVSGMTIDLASDAEGKSATITVKNDVGSSQNYINSFLSALNDLTTYVREKTGTKKNDDDTYTRGTLAGEYGIRSVGNELLSMVNQDFSNTGIFSNLSEIGISVNTDLKATISDTSKLSTALSAHFNDVISLLDSAMTSFSNKVGTYAGTSGYINQTITSEDTTISNLTSRITSINERISRREEYLVKYYADYQAQMETYMNQSKINSAWYG